MARPLSRMFARGRFVDAHERAGERGLAAAAFADEAERLALADCQVDDIDRPQLPARRTADHVDPRSLDGKMHRHAGDLD